MGEGLANPRIKNRNAEIKLHEFSNFLIYQRIGGYLLDTMTELARL